jgi:Stigma-specific protein, Stig1
MNFIMRSRLTLFAAAAALMLAAPLHAQVPQLISYQGRVSVGGANFNGTGSFNFALVDPTGAISYWSNDGTNLNGTQPASAVSLTVTNGLYSVVLGDTSKANMTAIPASVFANSSVWLRVWFNDGPHGAQLLAPDQRIASVGYAIVAGSVTNGAVGLPQLGLGTISGQINCNLTDPTHTYVYLQGTSSLAYVGAPSGGNYPFQLTLVTPGTYTLVAHQSNGTETSTSVTVTAGQTTSGVTLGATDTTSDTNNCGSCGNVCNAPDNGSVSCVGGACQAACSGGSTLCTGACVNTLTDGTNCGECANVCVHGVPCVNGTCGCPNSESSCNGTCTNLLVDTSNCGSCGNACNSGPNGTPTCLSGACQLVCSFGYKDCDGNPANGCETNTNVDTNNCGACNNVCTANHAVSDCGNGLCGILQCNIGYADCNRSATDGCETNLMTDAHNCGTCGSQCPNGESCVSGACN